MRRISLRVAMKVVYWNFTAAVFIGALGLAAVVQRIHRYDTLLLRVGRTHGVDPSLLSAVIWKESRFDASAVGTKEEVGLMQLTEGAATEWALAERKAKPSRTDLFDPALNVEVGAWYLARAIRRWTPRVDDPLPYALAEYNAGRTAAERWAVTAPTAAEFTERITYPTTRRYVQDILARYRGEP
jgi:soluble lytic murein transglycosylase